MSSTREGALEDEIQRVFAREGPLARTLEQYAPRAEQLDMALAVARALVSSQNLVVEAGTGIGKTFAYLVPALLSGRRVVISTGTRALQDQLFRRDLPTLAKAVGVPVEVALLKGRSNYLCLHRLGLAQVQDARQAGELETIRAWRWRTRTGDIAEVEAVSEDSPVWSRVTSTSDNCLGTQCSEFQNCHVARARREAVRADIIVVNHHLLLADLALRDEGFGELLPHADSVIVDEAHQLPPIAAQQFGSAISSAQVSAWLQEFLSAAEEGGVATPRLRSLCSELLAWLATVRRALGPVPRRIAWSEVLGEVSAPEVVATLERVLEGLETLAADAQGDDDDHQREGAGAMNPRRARDLAGFLQGYLHAECAAAESSETQGPSATTATLADGDGMLRWVDVHKQSFSLHLTPVESAAALGSAMANRECHWVLTSATLAVDGDFTHFVERVGLAPDSVETLRLDSPFDYARNSLLYLPEGLPDPGRRDYVEHVCTAAAPLVDANPGGTFMLFTSYRALEIAWRWFDGRTDRLTLVQGTSPRSVLLQRFRQDGRALLLGTSSFWEGVDVRGPALSLVIIDKLPFASPAEPLLRARLDWLEQQGRSGFRDQLLPAAVIALKQGVGRLIRDHGDRGVMMLCDPRLQSKGYGKRFLRSLPAMPRVSDTSAAVSFLQTMSADSGPAPATAPDDDSVTVPLTTDEAS